MFMVVLPVIIVLSVMAINIAQMQLVRTELKIASDAAARAGGRAFSEFGDLDKARAHANKVAMLNDVAGSPAKVGELEVAGDVIFGNSVRTGKSRFEFTPMTDQEIENGAIPTGVRVSLSHEAPFLFELAGKSSFAPTESSVSSQVDRDIALVYDRSGSMAYFDGGEPGRGEKYLYDTITELYETGAFSESEYLNAVADYQAVSKLAKMSLKSREYSQAVIDLLPDDLRTYAESVNSTYRPGTDGPQNSQWAQLEKAHEVFFDVLRRSDRQQLVSLSSFASGASIDVELTTDLNDSEEAIDKMYPDGSTSMGEGMLKGWETLKGEAARSHAVPTIIVLSDGVSKKGTSPPKARDQILAENPNVVIHTVTFGGSANIAEMQAIADSTNGKHYHADNGAQLIKIFHLLASSLPTIITE